jgi:hypothetical protein
VFSVLEVPDMCAPQLVDLIESHTIHDAVVYIHAQHKSARYESRLRTHDRDSNSLGSFRARLSIRIVQTGVVD